MGKVSDNELHYIYQIAHVFVLPSLYEPFGLVVLEAMAKGRAVIVSDKVGISSVIKSGKDGIIVPYGNVKRLVEEIDFLLQNPKKREKIRKDARKTAKRYTWNKIAKKYVEAYCEVLGCAQI